ncbi:MAG: hypothetical protein ABEK36_04425 [Candidatus Aenigmatarchaeota archaeon]
MGRLKEIKEMIEDYKSETADEDKQIQRIKAFHLVNKIYTLVKGE